MTDLTITQRVVRRARDHYGLTVLDHAAWGSKARNVYAERRRSRPVRVAKADTVWQHITVTLDTGKLSGDFKTDVQTVERIGLERFGSGVSYNFVVDMATGMIAVGQPLDAKGTHTVNNKGVKGFSYDQNHAGRAIAVLGMPNDKLSPKAQAAIVSLLAAMVDEGAITEGFDYVPHSLVAFKDCPCNSTRDRMSAIRKAVDDVRRPAPPKPTRKPAAKPTRVQHARAQLQVALETLTRAVDGGRRGTVKAVRDNIEQQAARLPRK